MLLFTIKFIHAVILVYMLACIGLIWHYALTGLYGEWLWLAVGSLLLEVLVWFACGMRCPLTTWALALGDPTGADLLSDIVFVEPVNTAPQYGFVFAAGLVAVAVRNSGLLGLLHERIAWHNHDGETQPIADHEPIYNRRTPAQSHK